ncbi:MAG: hypothetical protein CMJ68_03755 [Planctomycetaceae bacterium]|nr:hypothetical protein [Planctomycetaceae bacterium]
MATVTAMSIPTAPTPSDCPTPLSWQQVLSSVEDQSETWEINGDRGLIQGRAIGSGPALVFLNPLLGNWQMMALTAWVLRDEFRCILYDDSSFLEPRPRIAPGTVDDLVADLWRVCEQCCDGPVVLVGTGLGSAVGLSALAEHDNRIAAAVLQGPLVETRLTAPERCLTRIGSHLPGRLSHLPGFRSLMVHNHQPWFPPFDQSRLAFAVDNTGNLPLRIAARRARRLDQLDLADCLDRLASSDQPSPPILLIVPESLQNESLPSRSTAVQEILSHVSTASVEALAGCGPLGCLTHPHRLAKLVRTFLQESDSNRLPPMASPGS